MVYTPARNSYTASKVYNFYAAQENNRIRRYAFYFATVAESADAGDLKSPDSNIVQVQLLSAAPNKIKSVRLSEKICFERFFII